MELDEILTMCNLEKKVYLQTLQKQTKQLLAILDPLWHFDFLFRSSFLRYIVSMVSIISFKSSFFVVIELLGEFLLVIYIKVSSFMNFVKSFRHCKQ